MARRKTINQITEQANRILKRLTAEYGARKDFQRGIEAFTKVTNNYYGPIGQNGYSKSKARTFDLGNRVLRVKAARDKYLENTANARGYNGNIQFAAYKNASATRNERMGIASKGSTNG